MTCPRCANQNSPDAADCGRCGQPLSVSSTALAASLLTYMALWRKFIGPRADYYLERFRLYRDGQRARFSQSWHCPAFGPRWLRHRYRKMYLPRGVWLFGGRLPTVVGAGLVGVV